MTDADPAYVVLTAPLLDDFVSVGAWTEVSRVRSEPEAVKLAATLRSNDAVARVLRASAVIGLYYHHICGQTYRGPSQGIRHLARIVMFCDFQ